MGYSGPAGLPAPKGVRSSLGLGRLEKGRWDDLYVWAWDFAEKCTWEKCEIYDLCEYKNRQRMGKESPSEQHLKGKIGGTDKCMMQQRYLRNVLHAVMETMKKKKSVDSEQMIRMGYQMIPLYAQLYKFKKMEFSNHELTYMSEKGSLRVNPIYKEIREIIKTIEGIWCKLGSGIRDRKAADQIGDGSYIDAMHSALSEENSAAYLPQPDESIDLEDGLGLDFEFDQKPQKAPKPLTAKKKAKERSRAAKNRKLKKKAKLEALEEKVRERSLFYSGGRKARKHVKRVRTEG